MFQIICEGPVKNPAPTELFAPIFTRLHNDISGIQEFAHFEAYEIARNLSKGFSEIQYYTYPLKRNKTLDELEEKVKVILRGLNLTGFENTVQKCNTAKNSSKEQIHEQSEGGIKICRAYIDIETAAFQKILSDLYEKQYKQHLKLEDVKILCESIEFEAGQKCFIDNLFQFVDTIKDLHSETRNFLDLYTCTNNYLLNNFNTCVNIVYDLIIADSVNLLISEYQECCKNVTGMH